MTQYLYDKKLFITLLKFLFLILLSCLFYYFEQSGIIKELINPDSISQLKIFEKDNLGKKNNQLFYYLFSNLNYKIYIYNFVNLLLIYFLFTKNLKLIFLFPFYFSNFFLPSKELIILATSILFIYAYLNKKFFLTILSIVLIYFCREANAYFFLFFVFLYELKIKYEISNRKFILFLFFVFYFINFLVNSDFLDFISVVKRYKLYYGNFSIVENNFLIHIFGNLTNLSFRNIIFFDPLPLNFFKFSLFISGLTIFYSFLNVFIKFFQGSVDSIDFMLPAYLFFISINDVIQPRYLIPLCFSYLLLSNSKIFNLKTNLCFYLFFLLLSIMMNNIYFYLFNDHPILKL